MIPKVAHVAWMGRKLPLFAGLAIRSAALRGGFHTVILHHTDPLEPEPWFPHVFDVPGVERRLLDPDELMAPLGRPSLVEGFRKLTLPANRSDILRAALLYRHGGVYLDTDVVVLRSFEPLFGEAMFLGKNRSVYDHRSAQAGLRGAARMRMKSFLRMILARLPKGHRLFRRIERIYPEHTTTGIWGSEARHPALARVLDRTAELLGTEHLHNRDYNFVGPFLVQGVLAERDWPGVRYLPPAAFYPLPPVMARLWFRAIRDPSLDDVVSPETIAVHWYASNEVAGDLAKLSFESIRALAPRQLFSAIALPLLPTETA